MPVLSEPDERGALSEPAGRAGPERPDERGALSEAAEGFLADLGGRGRSINTLEAYRRDLAAYEGYLAGRRLTVTAATSTDVARYVAGLEAAGRRPASVARALVAVRALHRWCGSEAAMTVDAPEPGRAAAPAALTVAEAATLVESPRGGTPAARRDRALLELLYATGGRISEVVGLDVGDVGDGAAHFGGRNRRFVPYGEPAAAALAAWLAPPGRTAMAAAAPAPLAAGGGRALFLNRQGGRLSRQWGWSVVRAHGTAAGLSDRLGPHVLRHSFAAHVAGSGAPPAAVQQLLVGQPVVLEAGELADSYRRWHPRSGARRVHGPFT